MAQVVLNVERFFPDEARAHGMPENWLSAYVDSGTKVEDVPKRLEAAIRVWAGKFLQTTDRRVFYADLETPKGLLSRFGEADVLSIDKRVTTVMEVKCSSNPYVISEARKQLMFLGSLLDKESDLLRAGIVFLDTSQEDNVRSSFKDVRLSDAVTLWTDIRDRGLGYIPTLTFKAADVWDWAITEGLETSFADFTAYVEMTAAPIAGKKPKATDSREILLDSHEISRLTDEAIARLVETTRPCGSIFREAKAGVMTKESYEYFTKACAADLRAHERDLLIGFAAIGKTELVRFLEESHEIIKRYFDSDLKLQQLVAIATEAGEVETASVIQSIADAYRIGASTETAVLASTCDTVRFALTAKMLTTSGELETLLQTPPVSLSLSR